MAVLLVLLMVGNQKIWKWSGFQWCHVHTKFHDNQ